jgi:hypothetical protein
MHNLRQPKFSLARSLFSSQWLLALLLATACGARTAFEGDHSSAPNPAAGGVSGGEAPHLASWDQITWVDESDQSVVYLWTGSGTDTWAVTSAGEGSFFRDHWDGSRWTRTVGERDSRGYFGSEQIWGAQGRRALAGSPRSLERWSNNGWTDWQETPGCHAISGSAEDDVWCATESELWRFDGRQWLSQPMSGIRGIQARARSDVWAWGTEGARHFDGVRFWLELAGLVRHVSASEPTNVWAVRDGDVLHQAGPGSEWTRHNLTGSQIASVWSQSKTNTWVIGAGAVMRWNGSSWTQVPLPTQDEWLFISGSSEDVWIAGTQKLIHGRPTRR